MTKSSGIVLSTNMSDRKSYKMFHPIRTYYLNVVVDVIVFIVGFHVELNTENNLLSISAYYPFVPNALFLYPL